jgi:general stress protein 26
MEVAAFADIESEFLQRVHTMVWCNVATIDSRNRPRSRVLHPIWIDGTGWIATRPTSHKAKHLAANPYVSLAYVADIAKPVYADCYAEWDDSAETKQWLWEQFLNVPPPLGYDMAPIFGSVDSPGYGVLKLTPWRIELAQFPQPPLVWRNPALQILGS